jgi:2'-5' RNA ligase
MRGARRCPRNSASSESSRCTQICSPLLTRTGYYVHVMFYMVERSVREPPIKYGPFTLVFPEARAAAQIGTLAHRFRRVYGLKAKPLLISRFHVSLNDLGEYDDQRTAEAVALRALEAVANVRTGPFTVMFNLVQSFAGRDGNRALVLRGDEGVVGLERLQQSLRVSLRMAGIKSPSRFTPHVTLLYSKRSIDERFVEPISWTVREFALVVSLRGQTKYDFKGRWPLAA